MNPDTDVLVSPSGGEAIAFDGALFTDPDRQADDGWARRNAVLWNRHFMKGVSV